MKIQLFIILSILLIQDVSASCFCKSSIDDSNVILIDQITENQDSCYSEIRNRLFLMIDDLKQCQTNNLNITWGCSESVRIKKEKIAVDCQQFLKAKHQIELQESLTKFKGKSPKLNSLVSCGERIELGDAAALNSNVNLGADKIELSFKTEAELKEALAKFVPGAILDRPEKGIQFSIDLPNDNNGFGLFDYFFKKKSGDDMGYTHGMDVKIGKKLDGSGYFVTMEYSTKLYTERIPGVANFYDSKNKVYVVPQNFLEENVLKVVVDNMKENKAFYMKAGVGIQNLNQKNPRGALISAARQQQSWHKYWSKKLPNRIKMYDSRGVGKDRYGVILDFDIGKKKTIYQDKRKRIQYNTSVGITGSTFSGASSVRGRAEISADYQYSPTSLAYRVVAGLKADMYSSGQEYLTSFFAIEAGGSSSKVGFKYEKNQRKDGPNYLVHAKKDITDPTRNTIGTIYYVHNF